MGILIPCVAKHLLRLVLSMTPGNLFALKTWKTCEKQDARTGAEPLLRLWGDDGEPTLTKFIFSLSFVSMGCYLGKHPRDKPKATLRPDTEILQDEPHTHHSIRVGKLKGTYAEAANQVPCEHAARYGSWVRSRSGR